MADDTIDSSQISDLNTALDGVQTRAASLTVSANGFASAMSRAFTQSASGGKQFDDVLKSAVTAGFLFDVPVRFDTDYLEVDLSAFAAGAIPKIPLVEIKP
jgi:uncharacterized protein (TIGR02217 family)